MLYDNLSEHILKLLQEVDCCFFFFFFFSYFLCGRESIEAHSLPALSFASCFTRIFKFSKPHILSHLLYGRKWVKQHLLPFTTVVFQKTIDRCYSDSIFCLATDIYIYIYIKYAYILLLNAIIILLFLFCSPNNKKLILFFQILTAQQEEPQGLRSYLFFFCLGILQVYLWVIGSNLILRCTWTYKLSAHLRHNYITVFTITALEMLRRFQWVFFRVENEWNKMNSKTNIQLPMNIDQPEEEHKLLNPSDHNVQTFY